MSNIEVNQNVAILRFWDPAGAELQVKEYLKIKDEVDYTVVFCAEASSDLWPYVIKMDAPRTSIYFGGVSRNGFSDIKNKFKFAELYFWPKWLSLVTEFCTHMRPDWLDNYDPFAEKPYYFDILLGLKRDVRDCFYNELTKNNLIENNIVSYHQEDINTDNWLWFDDEYNDQVFRLNDSVGAIDIRHNVSIPLSCIIDRGIYNQSAYSVISETSLFDDPIDLVFFTEKLAKPIIARRLFIISANQPGALTALHSIGFKTFHGIIDESYDTISDQRVRHQMIAKEISKLCQQPQKETFNLIRNIVEHNYQVLMKLICANEDDIISSVIRQHR